MKTKDIIEKEINNIWKDYSSKEYCKFPPICVSELPERGIIFIGLNPSLDEKIKPSKNDIEFYTIDTNHRYFKKFSVIADNEKINLPWGHIDLLYFRETKQSKIYDIFKDKDGIDFIHKQLMVTKMIMDKLFSSTKPIIFVVNNTLAREFLGKNRPSSYSADQPHWMDYRFVWDDNLGTHTYLGHPFFFTSMLTGQRALDNGSFERLIWHIKYVKNKLKIE